jgi:perosamine synthetase
VVGAREEELVLEALRNGDLSTGPSLRRFERALAHRLGAVDASAVSSGTAGLHLAVRAAGVRAGDEVLTTPFSFVASANCLLYEAATPVFCDIDRRTLNLDPVAAEAAVGPRTTAILPVHIFGYPADMRAFERIASDFGLALVEDCCQALGATHADGTPVGGRGNLSVFGFYANKQLTTGEGGMVICPSAVSKTCIDSERNQGRASDSERLDHDGLGYNYRLSELACALGLAQLERLDDLLARRRQVAALYAEALRSFEDLELPCEDVGGDRRGWFVYVVGLPRSVDRAHVIRALRADGIDSRPYFPAIHLLPHHRERFGHRRGEFPVCEEMAERSLALPFFPQMTDGQVERVAEALTAALEAAHAPDAGHPG